MTGHANSAGIHFEAAFTPDAKYVICGSQDGKVYSWDVQSGAVVGSLNWHVDPPKV